jgi:hypothetical protein
MNSHEAKLKAALDRLETSVRKILSTRGYSKDAKSLKLLQEMIREQLIHANTRSATRSIR